MKKSELKQIIREEIKKILNENVSIKSTNVNSSQREFEADVVLKGVGYDVEGDFDIEASTDMGDYDTPPSSQSGAKVNVTSIIDENGDNIIGRFDKNVIEELEGELEGYVLSNFDYDYLN